MGALGAVLALVSTTALVAAEFACTDGCLPVYSERATEVADLRASLLGSAYDSKVAPIPDTGSLSIAVAINFFSFRDIELETGRLELRVWLDMIWQDERLRWNTTTYPNTDRLQVTSDSDGNYEIWVPDLALGNPDIPLQQTLSHENAIVYNNGTVWLSRPGFIAADCMFDHIAQFPWDYPACTFELGSWSMTATTFELVKYGRGWAFGGLDSSDLFTATAREFQFHRVDVTPKQYVDAIGIHDNWRALQYTVTLKRRTRLIFVAKTIVPHVLLTACSFVAFFMNPECQERLVLGASLVFIELMTTLAFADSIPRTSRWTALSKITTAALYMTICSLIESSLVCCAYWYARTVRPKPTTKPGLQAKLVNMWKMPKKHANQNDLPVLLKRQQTQAKLRAQMRASSVGNEAEFEYDKKDEEEKKVLRQKIRDRKVQARVEAEHRALQEHRYRFVASRIDLAALLAFPITYTVVLFVFLAEIAYQVSGVQSGNLDETVVLGYEKPEEVDAAASLLAAWPIVVALLLALRLW